MNAAAVAIGAAFIVIGLAFIATSKRPPAAETPAAATPDAASAGSTRTPVILFMVAGLIFIATGLLFGEN